MYDLFCLIHNKSLGILKKTLSTLQTHNLTNLKLFLFRHIYQPKNNNIHFHLPYSKILENL